MWVVDGALIEKVEAALANVTDEQLVLTCLALVEKTHTKKLGERDRIYALGIEETMRDLAEQMRRERGKRLGAETVVR